MNTLFKKNRILQLIIVAIFVVASALSVPSSSIVSSEEVNEPGYVRTVFNMSNGLPTDEANAVLQTDDGYLWIGSYGGLLRYDGSTFRNFSEEGAIATPSISRLFEDSAGNLWIGSSDSGVFVYDGETFKAVPCTEKYGYLSIRDFAESDDGKIFVASSSGVCEIIDGVMTPLSDNAVKGETVLGIGVDPYRRLWCVLNSGDYVVLQYGKCVAMLDITSFSSVNAKLTCVTTDISRNVYIGTTGREFFKIEFTNEELTRSGYSVTTYDSQDALNHNRISVMENGDMLVSSRQGFAWVKPNGESVDLHTQKTMGGVNSSIIDYEGNVWLASSNEGLIRYVPGYFSSPNIKAGLTGVDVNAVTSAGGVFYVGTDNGLLAFDESWNPVSNAISEKLKTAHIQNLMTDSNGLLWCGTYSEFGVVRYNSSTGEIKVFNVENGIESENVRVSLELSDGTIAVGTQDGIAFIRGDAVISFFDKDNGLKTHSILSLAEAPNGSLLAGSAGSGIYAIRKGGEVASFGEEQGLEDGVVLRIVPDSKEHCFVSAGSSLYYWQGGVFTKLENLKIGVGSIYDVVERNGRLWLMQDG